MDTEKDRSVDKERLCSVGIFILVFFLALGAAFVIPNSLAEFRWDGLSFKGVASFGAFVLVFVGGIGFFSFSLNMQFLTIATAGIRKPASVEEIEHPVETVDLAMIKEDLDAFRSLLSEHDEIVLVEKLGELEGIITTADLESKPSEKIEDMITPWNKVVKVHENTSLSYAKKLFREHSRIPIIDKNGLPRGIIKEGEAIGKFR